MKKKTTDPIPPPPPPPSKKPATPPKPSSTTISTISVLQQILEQAKLSNVLLNKLIDQSGQTSAAIALQLRGISDQITAGSAIALASQQNLKDIDVELASQGEELEEQGKTLIEILEAIQGPFQPTTGSTLTQTNGDSMGPYSILAGTSGTFLRSDLPADSGGLATGTIPNYVSSDPAVVIGSDPQDPSNPDKFSAAVPATDTAPSFDVAVTITPALDATGAPGTTVTNTFTVLITQTPPPFVPTTGSDLTQTGGIPGKVARTRR